MSLTTWHSLHFIHCMSLTTCHLLLAICHWAHVTSSMQGQLCPLQRDSWESIVTLGHAAPTSSCSWLSTSNRNRQHNCCTNWGNPGWRRVWNKTSSCHPVNHITVMKCIGAKNSIFHIQIWTAISRKCIGFRMASYWYTWIHISVWIVHTLSILPYIGTRHRPWKNWIYFWNVKEEHNFQTVLCV